MQSVPMEYWITMILPFGVLVLAFYGSLMYKYKKKNMYLEYHDNIDSEDLSKPLSIYSFTSSSVHHILSITKIYSKGDHDYSALESIHTPLL